MQTGIVNTGGSTTGGNGASLFTFDSDDIWSKPTSISEPMLVNAIGLCEMDKIYLHYGKKPKCCTDIETTRVAICKCHVHMHSGQNIMFLPWAGTWQLEYEGTGQAWVYTQPLRVSWDSALEIFMKQAIECCGCGC